MCCVMFLANQSWSVDCHFQFSAFVSLQSCAKSMYSRSCCGTCSVSVSTFILLLQSSDCSTAPANHGQGFRLEHGQSLTCSDHRIILPCCYLYQEAATECTVCAPQSGLSTTPSPAVKLHHQTQRVACCPPAQLQMQLRHIVPSHPQIARM